MIRLHRNPTKISYVVRLIKNTYPHLSNETIAESIAYGTFVSLEHRLFYAETPKAACTTIKHLLRDLSGAPPIKYEIGPLHETRRDMFIHVRANIPLPSLIDLDNETQEHVLTDPSFLRFCIVRNPYSRLISAWRNKIIPCEPGYESIYEQLIGAPPPIEGKSIPSFDAFLKFLSTKQDLDTCNPHWRRQLNHIFYSAISYTHIGKLETLQDTLLTLHSHLGNSISITPPTKNRSARDDQHGCLTESSAQLIYQLYKRDFDILGYASDSWRPFALTDRITPALVPESKFLDEIIERNLIISYLYEQYETQYRYSAHRLRDLLRSILLKI